MDEISKTIRTAVIEHIRLLARASLQTQYEKDVPLADVPAELVCGFCDDLFHPKSQAFQDAFTADEIRDLAVLYGLLHLATQGINESHPPKVADLQKLPEWRSVMTFAKELEANFDISE
jgi:CHAT domain-containing protein